MRLNSKETQDISCPSPPYLLWICRTEHFVWRLHCISIHVICLKRAVVIWQVACSSHRLSITGPLKSIIASSHAIGADKQGHCGKGDGLYTGRIITKIIIIKTHLDDEQKEQYLILMKWSNYNLRSCFQNYKKQYEKMTISTQPMLLSWNYCFLILFERQYISIDTLVLQSLYK